ncbi:HAMP domain-containing sensor histidine kinase [Curvibacter sp. APW13]|uniref:sensor histidine kinase n=1 Tax=Curvibacter sp. APW13 TaxID=3077236 RepID=UPI0028DF9EFF|nr:HAMP domain-containing sensor histidine kinase [Curvibacter sp. APW13]MDT8990763.1 HAMP domain-containing sensor histidine kinase [Curvibacter sp. APW13]
MASLPPHSTAVTYLSRLGRGLRSLRVAIGLTVVAGVLVGSVATYLRQTSLLRESHERQIQQELDRLGLLAALALREPLWQFAPEQADSIIEAAFINPDVTSISVWDHKGVPFAERDRNREPDGTEPGVEVIRDIERDGAVVGKLRIRMSTAGYLARLQELRQQYLVGAAQSSLLALVFIVILLQWRLVRPLKRLVEASSRIESGQLASPIRPVFHDEVGSLATSLDATRRALLDLIAQLEARNTALLEVNQHLEQRVAERTASLESALNNLERAQKEIVQTEKLASLGRIVAGVAHELNTPIGNALTVTTTLENDVLTVEGNLAQGALRKSELQELLRRLHEGLALASSNLGRSAGLIADFKQVAVDHASDQRRDFDIGEVSHEILNMLHPTLRKSGCTVERHFDENLRCDGFPGRYGQVLTNLVMNAVHHAFEAGTEHTLRVDVHAAGDDQVVLRVADNGVGMPDEVRQRIFDPFFTTKMGRGGTGLGMNIVHGIVLRLLGGSIEVTSTLGQGTTVTVTLPRKAPEAPTA